MKSSKKLTYLLILAVAGVWGVIFYHIFSSAGGEDEIPASFPVKPKEDLSVNYELRDTFSLVLNYRDPFLEADHAATKQNTAQQKVVSPPAVTVQLAPVNFSFLAYTGYIINPASQKVITVLSFNGKERMMEEGEIAEGVKLLKNAKDSVRVSYLGKTRYIRLK